MEVKDYLGKTGLARFLENCKNLFAPKADLEAHTSEANPHNITKTEVGLENVDNTSDAEKPVSVAQAEAIADAKKAGTDAQANLAAHNTNTSAHADLRSEMKALADRINAALDSDDETLDELSEIVAYIKSNKSTLDGITAEKVADWNDAAAKKHSHANSAVLDGITADNVTAWNGKGRVIAAESQPSDLAGTDLWIQIVK